MKVKRLIFILYQTQSGKEYEKVVEKIVKRGYWMVVFKVKRSGKFGKVSIVPEKVWIDK